MSRKKTSKSPEEDTPAIVQDSVGPAVVQDSVGPAVVQDSVVPAVQDSVGPDVAQDSVVPARNASFESTTVVLTADNRIHLAILFVLAIIVQIVLIQPSDFVNSISSPIENGTESSRNTVYLFMINSGDREPPDLAIKVIFW